MYTEEDILKDKEFQYYIRSRGLKNTTINTYKKALIRYCNYNEMLLSDLIDEAEKEQNNTSIKPRHRTVNSRIHGFIEHLVDKGFSRDTIIVNIKIIKAIYNACDIETKSVKIPLPQTKKDFHELISIDEIRLAVRSAGVRDRAIILTQVSSGMGRAELKNLTYGDLLKASKDYHNKEGFIPVDDFINIFEGGEFIFKWKLTRVKTGYPFITFTSPEANREILNYLKYRLKRGYPPVSLDSPLFTPRNKMSKLNGKTYSSIFQSISDRLGLGFNSSGQRRFTGHALRRFFATQCIRAGLDKMAADWILGHKINEQDATYFRYSEDELLRRYLKVLPYVTLDKVKRVKVDDPEVRELRREVEELRKYNKELKESALISPDKIKGYISDLMREKQEELARMFLESRRRQGKG